MRNLPAQIAVLGLCAAAGCQSASGPAGGTGDPIAQNKAFSREAIAAIENRDLDALMAQIHRSTDVIFMGPEGEVGRGWEHLRPVEQDFLSSFTSAQIEIEDEMYSIFDDTAVAVLTLKGDFTFADGTSAPVRIRMADVRRKEGGKWSRVSIYNHSHDLAPDAAGGPPAPGGGAPR